MSYENAINTRQVASSCVFCGRPLVDAFSVESGAGPDCRGKYGAVGAPAPVDREKLKLMVETAPEKLRAEVERELTQGGLKEAVQRAIWHAERDYETDPFTGPRGFRLAEAYLCEQNEIDGVVFLEGKQAEVLLCDPAQWLGLEASMPLKKAQIDYDM